MSDVTCFECGRSYSTFSSYVGMRCECGNHIPPEDTLPIVKKNIAIKEQLGQKALEIVKKKHLEKIMSNISQKDVKITLEFNWVFDGGDPEEKGFSHEWNIKFHNTPDYGPTVDVTMGNDTSRLPAQLIIEVAEFLVEQGVMESSGILTQSNLQNEGSKHVSLSPNLNPAASSDLELPVIEGVENETPVTIPQPQPQPQPQPSQYPSQDTPEEPKEPNPGQTPLQSFGASPPRSSGLVTQDDLEDNMLSEPPEGMTDENVPDTPDELKKEATNMAKERQEAAQRAAKSKPKTIKKRED